MKEFNLYHSGKKFAYNLPTSLDEIDKTYLLSITANINVADNYSLVAIVYHETLSSIILTYKQKKKNLVTGVVPIFIKAGNTKNEFNKHISCKDKLIISSTQLSLGHHVACPSNELSLDKFIANIDRDKEIYQRYKNSFGNEEVYFIEFKLVPNCDIVGYYNSNITGKIEKVYTTITDNK